VVVGELHVVRAAVPAEDDPPLAVDAHRVEAGQLALELLQVVARRRAQILDRRRRVEDVELVESAIALGGERRSWIDVAASRTSSLSRARSRMSAGNARARALFTPW
jgi:hypothetical protein